MLAPSKPPLETPPAVKKPAHTWRQKFGDAFRGLKLGIRGHSSFFVHFFLAALVSATAIVLGCSAQEWCLLIFCIGLVFTAELVNSAVEALFHGQDERVKARNFQSLDIAAGAVLLASLTAAVVGAIVFIPRIARIMGWI